jgi:hypothetical protein
MTLAALHVTKCRLCGQPPAGPGGLCSDCSRALARAREGPAAARSGTAAAARRQRIVERIVLTSPVDPEPARSPKKAGAALWATIGVVVVVLVLAATANLSPQRPVEVKVSERPARVVPQLLEPAPPNDPAEAQPPVDAPRKVTETPSLPKDSARNPAQRPGRGASQARGVADAKASEAPAVVASPPEVEPPVQQARANIAASAPAVDEGQSLAAMLEKCSEEKFLAGVICEQKARLRYCEGKWGQVPQCTKKPHVD